MNSIESDEELNNTPPELRQEANAAALLLLPATSKGRYEKQYNSFLKWMSSKNVNKITENVVLAYISERAKQINPASLWSEFSMTKTMRIYGQSTTTLLVEYIYRQHYNTLLKWTHSKNVTKISKNVVLAYVSEINKHKSGVSMVGVIILYNFGNYHNYILF